MPRVHTKIARFDRYRRGKQVPDSKTKKGYRIDRSQPADEHDTLLCKKGETYYHWTFRRGGRHESTTRPRPSQLTQSDFLTQVYGVQENLQDLEVTDAMLEDRRDEEVSCLQDLLYEVEEKVQNMESYEGLSNSPVAEMLRERVESLQEFIDELEAVDCSNEDGEEMDEDWQERQQEIIEELSECCYNGS